MNRRARHPLRVAFDGRSLSGPALRGWDRYTVGLIGELERLAVRVTLLCRARQPLHSPHLEGLGCDVLPLDDRGGLHWMQVAVPAALARGGFDVYHAPAEHGVPFVSPCPSTLTIHSVTGASYADLIAQGRLPGTVRDYLGHEPKRASFGYAYWRAEVARAKHVFVPSEFCRAEVSRFLRIPPSRVTTTPLAVHRQFQRPPSSFEARQATLARLGARAPYVLYVGGYETHKNVGGLLRAFALLARERPDLSLVLVGTRGAPAPLRQLAAELLPAGRVVFLADLTRELTDLYDGASLVATLSWRETFCLPALEGLSRGVPVVASAWGAAPEVVGDDGVGRLVDPRDEEAAALAMRALLDLPDRAAVAEAAKRRAARFDWKATAATTIEIYERLARR